MSSYCVSLYHRTAESRRNNNASNQTATLARPFFKSPIRKNVPSPWEI